MNSLYYAMRGREIILKRKAESWGEMWSIRKLTTLRALPLSPKPDKSVKPNRPRRVLAPGGI